MDDAEVVETIATGELDGLAAALDRYAAALFDSCHEVVADPEMAAEAVRDTFIVAWCRLDGLRDPSQLELWLHTVAGNECYRRLLTMGPRTVEADAADGAVAERAAMPARLPGQVLMACADNTPAGRADRVSIAHRAGPFGRNGFPKTVTRPGRPRWRPVHVHRRSAAAVAVVVVALAAAGAGVGALVLTSGPRHGNVSAAGQRRGTAVGGAVSSGAALPPGSAVPVSPGASGHPQSQPATTGAPVAGQMAGAALQPTVAAQATGAAQPTLAVQPLPSPQPTVTQTAVQGTLLVSPLNLVLVPVGGQPGSGTIVLTAHGGPVSFSITIPPGHQGQLVVTPSSASLAAGASATITVTAVTAAPINVPVTVNPGGDTVQVRSGTGSKGGAATG